MTNYQRTALEKMLALHKFIAAHAGCTLDQMAAHFEAPRSTTRGILFNLRDGGYIVTVEYGALNGGRGMAPNAYSVSDKEPPTMPPLSKRDIRRAERELRDEDGFDLPCRRPRAVAVQIGIQRDAWTAAFFGPAQAAA